MRYRGFFVIGDPFDRPDPCKELGTRLFVIFGRDARDEAVFRESSIGADTLSGIWKFFAAYPSLTRVVCLGYCGLGNGRVLG